MSAFTSVTRIATVSTGKKITIAESIAERIVHSLSMPVLVVDVDGGVLHGNPAAGQFWQIASHRLPRYTLQQLFGGESLVCINVERSMRDETSFTLDPYQFMLGKDLPPLILRVQIDPVVSLEGNNEGAVVTFWDQTHREHLAGREQSHRLMDSIGIMIQRLAHELYNPLSGIKGATQLLARRMKDLPEFGEYPAVILKELERMERLVKNLLLQGGGQPLNRGRFNMHELLDNVIWFQSNSVDSDGVTFVRDYDPSLPELFADKDKLHQVFLNLIQNAVEASPPDGAITVRTRTLGPWQEPEDKLDPARTYFQVEVEDRGKGVDEEMRGNLFTPFSTSKKSGTGLGLSISYQIVRAHQGILGFRPAAPTGAIFSVTLPMAITDPS